MMGVSAALSSPVATAVAPVPAGRPAVSGRLSVCLCPAFEAGAAGSGAVPRVGAAGSGAGVCLTAGAKAAAPAGWRSMGWGLSNCGSERRLSAGQAMAGMAATAAPSEAGAAQPPAADDAPA
jgi:hypothetical protein